MRVELVPLIIGILVIAIGVAVAADAWGDPDRGPLVDRRRRMRASIDQGGEKLVGVGIVLLGAALAGRDAWRFGTIAVLLGTVLLAWGGIRNRNYIKEMLLFRGAARRGLEKSSHKERLRNR